MALIYNLIAGGECLSDLNVLRGDNGTLQLLGVDSLLAPTTAGEFVRKFDIGDIHDLNRAIGKLQQRVRDKQKAKVCTIDLDSSVYAQASTRKQGSNRAYNREIGYHPLFAFWEEEGELINSHLRRGNAYTSSRVIWFLKQTLARLPERKPKQLRADSGFYNKEVIAYCEEQQIIFGISADQTQPLLNIVYETSESAWCDIEKYGVTQVAELRYQPMNWHKSYRYIVKRELVQDKHYQLSFRYHLLVTNNKQDSALNLLSWHLQHANMENRIKEHKSGFALEKLPTQPFHANWTYLLIGQLAFNLIAWFKRLVLPKAYHHATIKTIRHQVLNLAGKIVHSARQFYLVLSDQYLYKSVWKTALNRLAKLAF
jgi:hypothetical protein